MKGPPTVRYETRGVLGGAYRGKALESRALRTHLVSIDADDNELRTACAQPIANIADEYADPVGHHARPTCPKCADRWDRLKKK
jgi:hypothetical protein